MVLEGSDTIEFENGTSTTLNKRDYLNITAHIKRKVTNTGVNQQFGLPFFIPNTM
ncbi:hypothetical protein [Pseudoalteromonas aurantia]|uniref:hypothetical protein n=1 Tax=Pseudoalteromonas aurantia TaxID=43654 RepID=UPI001BB29942|nr:hypothetical protein [Pseudoalteromonas aurantia]